MDFFGRNSTVDAKARRALGDLSEDSSPYEILRNVDDAVGDTDVDPDEVVQKMRALDESVDQKLGAVEGDDVEQKAMRDAAGTVASRTSLSADRAMDLLSATVEASEQQDASALVDAFDSVHGGDTDVDQRAQTDEPPAGGTSETADAGPDATPDTTETSPDSPGTETNDMSDTSQAGSTDPGVDPDDVDQKQDDEDGGDGGSAGPLDMLNDDARKTVEEFADLAGKPAEECVQEVLGVGGDGGDTDAPSAPAGEADTAGDDYDEDEDEDDEPMRQAAVDQMLDEMDLNERVADAVTSDEVISEMAGVVAQKLATDDDLADNLVETVDKKGDFARTDQTLVTAPSEESKTVGEAGAITGGDDE